MSHFTTVICTTEEGENVESLLERFCENTEGLNSEYLTFQDNTEEVTTSYISSKFVADELGNEISYSSLQFKFSKSKLKRLTKTDMFTLVGKSTDSSLLSASHLKIKVGNKFKIFKVINAKKLTNFENNWRKLTTYRFKLKEIKFKLINYNTVLTIEDFAYDHYGYVEYENTFGYWYNENAKWDWYSIGGRWNNELVAKEGVEIDTIQQPSWTNSKDDKQHPRACNTLKIKDFDIEGYKELQKQQSIQYFKYAKEQLNAGQRYSYFRPETITLETTLEEYLAEEEKTYTDYFIPYSIVTSDGEWIQKGEMGWFGLSSDECTQEEWETKVTEYFKNLDPETTITVVDCHI